MVVMVVDDVFSVHAAVFDLNGIEVENFIKDVFFEEMFVHKCK